MKMIDTRRLVAVTTALIAFTLGGVPGGSALAQAGRAEIGAGLYHVADWTRDAAFVDVMRQGRVFGPPNEPWQSPGVPTDSVGWPLADGGIVLMVEVEDVHGMGGIYKLSFNCANTPRIEFPGNSPGQVRNVVRDAATGVVTADLVFPEGGHQMMLSFSNTGGGLSNLKVIRPGYDADATFTTPFLEHLQRFSVIRFMDWTKTNNNPSVNWSDRSLPSTPSFASHPSGVPWELCIELCNTIQRDIWVNVPHMATEEYITDLATLLKDTLDPSLRIYVEYSNEVWNFTYGQAAWNLQKAIGEAVENPADLAYDGNDDQFVLAARRIARRSKEVADLFKTVFADGSESRIRPVFAAQIALPELWLYQGLTYLHDVHGPVGDSLYAAAGAPYFRLGELDENPNLTVDEVIDGLQASVDSLCDSVVFERNATLTTWHGVPLIAYEGGPDTFGRNNIESKRLASLDPRMFDICVDYLRHWHEWGFGEFVWYTAGASNWDTQFGTWTLTNDPGNQSTPKILAIDHVRTAPRPRPSKGQAAPGTIDARRHAFRPDNWQDQDWLEVSRKSPRRHDYLIHSDQTRVYRLRLKAGALEPGAVIEVLHNRQSLGSLAVPSTGSLDVFGSTPRVNVTLNAGMNVLRLQHTEGANYSIDELELEISGDVDGDGGVSSTDFLNLLDQWGSHGDCPGDLDCSGMIDAADLALLLNNWGPRSIDEEPQPEPQCPPAT